MTAPRPPRRSPRRSCRTSPSCSAATARRCWTATAAVWRRAGSPPTSLPAFGPPATETHRARSADPPAAVRRPGRAGQRRTRRSSARKSWSCCARWARSSTSPSAASSCSTGSSETRKELERTNEELAALVYGISHDLRSPIVTVIGYLELLADRRGATSSTTRRSHYLERISVSARYMDSLIRDLLELSRIGRTQTEAETVELDAIIEDIAAELRRVHPAATVRGRHAADRCDEPRPGAPAVHEPDGERRPPRRARRHHVSRVCRAAGGRTARVIRVADDGVGIPRRTESACSASSSDSTSDMDAAHDRHRHRLADVPQDRRAGRRQHLDRPVRTRHHLQDRASRGSHAAVDDSDVEVQRQ